MSTPIVPRNRSARAASVAGNPATARLESAVGNCFPGLEFDVRNLEGRFFPGILFRVITAPLKPVPEALPNQAGIKLVYLDYLTDPMLPQRGGPDWVNALLATYMSDTGIAMSNGRWYLHWLEQDGKRISCYDRDGTPYDGETLWRFVRCLSADTPLKIAVIRRDGPDPKPTVELSGYRRRYTGNTGVIDTAYPPGELTESMCNPWQHDFRDCACYYWASNHPDVVLGPADPEAEVDGLPTDPVQALTWLDWLRRDRSPAGAVAAPPSRAEAREDQLDHFEINRRWQDLAYVIGGREVGTVYQPPPARDSRPYASAHEMIQHLRDHLAPLEMTLCYLYLYGLYSLRDPDTAPTQPWASMPADLAKGRQFITLVAVGEMTHVRWVNQLLWELHRAGFYPPGEAYEPVVQPLSLPVVLGGGTGFELQSLEPLTPQVLAKYAAIERPGGSLDRAYARCVATLEQDSYRHVRHLYELAVRIDTDGEQHWERFRDLHTVFSGYGPSHPYLRPVRLATPLEAQAALASQAELVANLHQAYAAEAQQRPGPAQEAITQARNAMDRLRVQANDLARHGLGVPYFHRL